MGEVSMIGVLAVIRAGRRRKGNDGMVKQNLKER